MIRILCKSKIHRAVITEANLNYIGSITIDEALMNAADLQPFEQVHVLNVNNGQRATTYCIAGKKGSGKICLNGPTARLAQVGDIVIIIAYGHYSPEEINGHKPEIVFVDKNNRMINHKKSKIKK